MNKIFFIIWSNPWLYLTLFPIAEILAKKNFKIYIFCHKEFLNNKNFKNKNIKFIQFKNFKSPFLKKISFIWFIFEAVVYSLVIRPKFLIGFNLHGFFCSLILKKINKRICFIYYNYDFDLTKNIKSYFHKFLYKINIKFINNCELIIVPNLGRKILFRKVLKTKKRILVIKNSFSKNFKFKIKKKRNYISHMGYIGPGHYIDQIIHSAKFIHKEYKVLLAGICNDEYFDYIKNLINKNNLRKKVIIERNISNKKWYNYLSETCIGLVFYEPINVSNVNMNMTSQKMNSFIMANIPMIVNDNIDFKDKDYLYYSKSKPTPISISKKINYLLKNKLIYKKISNNLKKLFLKSQNLEFETKELLKFIDKQVN